MHKRHAKEVFWGKNGGNRAGKNQLFIKQNFDFFHAWLWLELQDPLTPPLNGGFMEESGGNDIIVSTLIIFSVYNIYIQI